MSIPTDINGRISITKTHVLVEMHLGTECVAKIDIHSEDYEGIDKAVDAAISGLSSGMKRYLVNSR